jgi:hypothetical protein
MEEAVKRGPGRPRKALTAKPEEPAPAPKTFKMKAKPNWETFDAVAEDSPDRLRIDPALVPSGFSLQWVTDSVYGQSMSQHRSKFERKGWTPIHQEDFDGVFDGMFMPKGAPGEIMNEGLVLMARPKEFTDKAKRQEYRAALEQVSIKEQALRGGDIPISLDARHSSALQTNKIGKSYERLPIPED